MATINVSSGQTSSGTVRSGDTENVLSGGRIVNQTNYGTTTVYRGGTSSDTVVASGGTSFLGGGVASRTTVASSGLYSVYSGGIDNGGSVNSGSYMFVGVRVTSVGGGQYTTTSSGYSAGTANNTVVNGFMYVISNGYASNTTINSNGTALVVSGAEIDKVYVNSGGIAGARASGIVSGITVSSGGTGSIANGGILSGTMTLANGAKGLIGPTAGGIVDMQGNDNTGVTIVGLSSSGGTVNTNFTNFNGQGSGNSDGIVLSGISPSDVKSVTYPTADQVRLSLKNGGSVLMNITGAQKAGYTLANAPNGDLMYEVCFLAGSLIQTPDGEAAVETLQIGDSVSTYDAATGETVTRQITWAGQRKAMVDTSRPETDAGYPVRILKNALAENIPSTDLLITPEHCLYVNGGFIPARMLVNGRSIIYDHSITSYDYFHIETENHAIIWANNTLTESYLDTGNRQTFTQTGRIASLHPTTPRTWENDAAAPLTVARNTVEPLFNSLIARAEMLGLPHLSSPVSTTEDADLHILSKDGTRIDMIRQQNGWAIFNLPAETQGMHLVSRASRPSDAIGPFVDDRRSLGVLVGEIRLYQDEKSVTITNHLEDATAEGWHAQENSPCRWTTGFAALSLEEGSKNGALAIKILASGPYLKSEDTELSGTEMHRLSL